MTTYSNCTEHNMQTAHKHLPEHTGGPNYNFLFKDCIDWTCKDKLEHIKTGSSPKMQYRRHIGNCRIIYI